MNRKNVVLGNILLAVLIFILMAAVMLIGSAIEPVRDSTGDYLDVENVVSETAVCHETGCNPPDEHESWRERSGVYHIHGFKDGKPAYIENTYTLPSGKNLEFRIAFSSPCSDCRSNGDYEAKIALIDGSGIKHELFSDVVNYNDGWYDKTFDLSGYASQTVKIRFEAYAGGETSDWCSEHAGIDYFYVTSATGGVPTPTPIPAEPFIYIDIVSSPQGAQIWIDGEHCGVTRVTPFRKYFDRHGDHTFKLSLNGYQPYQESFYISESMTIEVILLTMEEPTPIPTPAPFIYIDIVSSPQGAQIWIDGEHCGVTRVTPFRKHFDRPGNHTFKLNLSGYHPYQESFRISEYRTIEVTLLPIGEPTPTPVPSDFLYTTPSTPGFLALSLLIAIFFVYFFMFKNKQ